MKVLLSIRLSASEPEHVLGKTLVFRAFETAQETIEHTCDVFVQSIAVKAYVHHELGGGDVEVYAEDLESGSTVYKKIMKCFCKDWCAGQFDYCVTTQKQLFD